jgi:hypothetical protein
LIVTTPYANSVFEQPWWLDIVAAGKWNEAVVKAEDKVIARLPYVISKGVITLPYYTQTLGIWMDESVRAFKKGNDQYYQQKKIISILLEQLPTNKRIDFIFNCANDYILPFRWEGFNIEPTFSYRITELKSMEEIGGNFSKSIQRDINKAQRNFILDDSVDSVEEFIELQNMTYSRQKRRNPIDNNFTRNVIKKAIAFEHGKLLIARDKRGIAHAGSFVLYDKNVCYHLLSGQDTRFGNDCAMPFLLHNEIAFALKNSRIFDFEGSMVEEIEQVYRRYGGKQVINWHVSKQSFISDIILIMKPRIKKIIGYKI